MKSKRSKACDISTKVKQEVYERDCGKCVICGGNGIPNMHYIRRSKGGLGIPQNIVCGCIRCHHEYDNGKKRKEYAEIIRNYLMKCYEEWNEEDLIYRKWGK